MTPKLPSKIIKSTSLVFAILISAFFIVLISIGNLLSAPNPQQISAPPAVLNAKSVTIPSTSGSLLSAWFVKGSNTRGGILLMHSIRSNRKEMIERAIFLNKNGYSVLLFDFQAHGQSTGKHITFGYLEAQDAEAAFSYLEQQLKIKTIGVIGVSLGGVAAILSNVSQRAKAMVLEAVYPSIKEAIQNRLAIRFGKAGAYLTPLLLLQIKPKLGFNPDKLTPFSQLANIKVPLLFIAGAQDQHTTLAESIRMYNKANHPKQLWVIQDATHENFYQHSPNIYQQHVLAFFKQHL